MKSRKVSFFKRVKDAVTNFEEYLNFSEEKLSVAIKYTLKLILIFTLIITIALMVKVIQEVNVAITNFETTAPEFGFENNELVIEGETKKVVQGDENGYFGFIVDSVNENLSDVIEAGDYQRVIGVLKNKIVIRDANGKEESKTYEELNAIYDLNNINKENVSQYLTGKNMTKIYVVFAVILFACLFIILLIQIFLDILFLSVVGYLLSRVVGLKLNYKSIFNISSYAITLSVILYGIYMVVNLFTGFTIKYFEIAYNTIAYIYIITAMFTIKSDLMKQQIEVGKIVEEQKKIREEKKQEKDEEQKEKKEEKTKKEKKENKREKGEEGTPEGNEA